MRAERSSVLVISAAPDDRPSTSALHRLVRSLEADGDIEVAVWFLRDGRHRDRWPAARVVDDLRSWAPVVSARRVGAEPIASFLGGQRLRSWRRRAAPDVVILDDGLGGRLLDRAAAVPVVLRTTPHPPVHHAEVRWTGPVAGVVDGDGSGPRRGAWHLVEPPPPVDVDGPNPATLGASRTRALFGLPIEAPVIAWLAPAGADDRTAALDLLASLPLVGGADVHLAWLVPDAGHEDLERRSSAAEARSLGSRVHPRSHAPPALLRACDVVADPYRVLSAEVVGDLDRYGATVVRGTSPPTTLGRGGSETQPACSVDALVAALGIDRADRAAAAARRADPRRFGEELRRSVRRSVRPPQRHPHT